MAITRRELLQSAGVVTGASLLAAKAEVRGAESAAEPAAAATVAPMANPADLLDIPDFEREAQARMSQMAWDYISEGAADELTLRWNRESYDRIRLRPR